MWAAIIIIVIALLLVLTAPKPKIENARAANLGDFQFPRSKEGDPLQWFLGTVRAKSPNSLWYGDYTPVPIKKKQKTGMFSSKKVIVGYEYHVGLDLCFGIGGDKPVTLRKLWSDKHVFWSGVQSVAGTLTVNLPNLFGGPEQRGGLVGSIDYYPGTFDQTRNAYLAAKADPEVPAYVGQCHLVFRGSAATKASGFYFGVTTNVNAISAELTRISSNVSALYSVMPNGLDVNPMEFMHAAFTEKFGMPGVGVDKIDMVSWVRDAEILYNEGMGMSLQVQQGITGKDLAEEALRIADGILFQDQNTGKIKSRLIRQDYDIEDLLVLDESIVEALTNFSKTTWAQTYNQCRVTFKDRETEYADKAAMAQDFANINFQQRVKNTDISVPGCFVNEQANQLAVRQLSLLSVPLFQIEIQCNRRASNLEPGDCFVFNYAPYGISNMIMRVQKIDKGTLVDGVVTINAVQDRFATATAVFAPPTGSGWVPVTSDAAPVTVRRIEELPFWFAQFLDIDIDDETQGLVTALAVPPGGASAYFDVDATTSVDSTYADAVQALVDAPYYGGGILEADYLDSVGRTDGYDATGFTLELVDVPLELVDGGGTMDRSGSMLLLMNGEFMLAENVTDNGDETYTFSEIRRALLDTRFQSHDAGDRCWIVKQSDDIMEVLFSNTGSFRARFIDNTPSDTLPVADATESTFTLTQRMERPAPPDYVTINGSRAPSPVDGGSDITLAWRARNRLTTALVMYDDAAEAAEATTDYGWRYRIDGGSWSAYIYVASSPQTIAAPAEVGIAEYEVVSRRDSLLSATADNVFVELTDGGIPTTDPEWDNVVSLLHFDGIDGGTTFIDQKGKTWTPSGDASLSTIAPIFGSASLALDGTGDLITCASHSDFDFGVDDFTIECWAVDASDSAVYYVFSFGPNWVVYMAGSQIIFNISGSNAILADITAGSRTDPHHIALTRQSGSVRLFYNGVMFGPSAQPASLAAGDVRVGAYGGDTNFRYAGLIDEFRITAGVARYTSTFIPPSYPLPDS